MYAAGSLCGQPHGPLDGAFVDENQLTATSPYRLAGRLADAMMPMGGVGLPIVAGDNTPGPDLSPEQLEFLDRRGIEMRRIDVGPVEVMVRQFRERFEIVVDLQNDTPPGSIT